MKKLANRLRANLLQMDQQPLGATVLTVLICLDIFILIVIFQGLSMHTQQLTEPEEYITQHCRELVGGERPLLPRLAAMVSLHRKYPDYGSESTIARQYPDCARLTRRVQAISTSATAAVLQDLSALTGQRRQVERELAQAGVAYDLVLQQMQSGVPLVDDHSALSGDAVRHINTLNTLAGRRTQVEDILEADSQIQALMAERDRVDAEALDQAYRTAAFWYPPKRLLMELAFLLPLLLLFSFWNRRSITSSRPFQTLFSSHLLVVTSIPVLIVFLDLLLDIIPYHLLTQVIDLLRSLKLVAIWHYVVIAASILVALLIVYLVHKNLFTQQKLYDRRIHNGQCQRCGSELPPHALSQVQACLRCGFVQFHPCAHCGQLTYVHGRHCAVCGVEQTLAT